MNLIHTKKFRHGSLSVALTVVVIAAVILINAIFTALTDKYLWYIDMTPEPIFTLSDEAKSFLDQMDQTKQVRIIFCDEADAWEADKLTLEVLKTARDIQKFYANVSVEYVDIYTNPSAVNGYRETSGKDITTQTVIVTCGSTARVYNLENFFKLDQDGYVTGYNGEQTMVSALLSVTQASAPVASLTVGHGEIYSEAFTTLLAQIGFEVKYIDLTQDDLDPDCRLLVVCDPTSDFEVKSNFSDVSEIDKIETFLAEKKSMMVFFDKDTPNLKNFEDFLKEWGIEIARTDDAIPANTVIRDLDSSATVNGFTNKAEYAPGENTGTAITKPLRDGKTMSPPVYFPNTTALRFTTGQSFKTDIYEEFVSSSSTANGHNRKVYNVFQSSATAVAMANGAEALSASQSNPFSYMMLSCESIANEQTGGISHAFVLACASTDFASNATLSNDRYGNAAVLSYACSTMGSLVVPVAIDCKYYRSMEISSITASAANQYTVILTVIPASLVFIAGIYVMIRRKHA